MSLAPSLRRCYREKEHPGDHNPYADLPELRICTFTYHYVNRTGDYCTYTLPMSAYTTYASLIAEATQEPPFPPL